MFLGFTLVEGKKGVGPLFLHRKQAGGFHPFRLKAQMVGGIVFGLGGHLRVSDHGGGDGVYSFSIQDRSGCSPFR